MNKLIGILLILSICAVMGCQAAVITETVEYRQGNTVLEGYLAYDDAVQGKRPAVLVAHEWMGITPYIRGRTEQLAAMGYVAFALDIYGKGVRPGNSQEASALAGLYKSDRNLMRARARAGFAVLKKNRLTDPRRIAVIGYCFGGTAALELARSGVALAGTVVFHGSLNTPAVRDAENIKGRVLALLGADDPHVPAPEIAAFESEMRQANVDWQLVKYGGAVHSFTNPAAGGDNAKGSAYNRNADQRSWQAMIEFFREIFE